MKKLLRRALTIVLSAAMLAGSFSMPVLAGEIDLTDNDFAAEETFSEDVYDDAQDEVQEESVTGEQDIIETDYVDDTEEPQQTDADEENIDIAIETEEEILCQDGEPETSFFNASVLFNDENSHYTVIEYKETIGSDWISIKTPFSANENMVFDKSSNTICFRVTAAEGYIIADIGADGADCQISQKNADSTSAVIQIDCSTISKEEIAITVVTAASNAVIYRMNYDSENVEIEVVKYTRKEKDEPMECIASGSISGNDKYDKYKIYSFVSGECYYLTAWGKDKYHSIDSFIKTTDYDPYGPGVFNRYSVDYGKWFTMFYPYSDDKNAVFSINSSTRAVVNVENANAEETNAKIRVEARSHYGTGEYEWDNVKGNQGSYSVPNALKTTFAITASDTKTRIVSATFNNETFPADESGKVFITIPENTLSTEDYSIKVETEYDNGDETPKWVSSKNVPAVKQTASDDVSFTLNITPPAGVDIDDSFYYAISLAENKNSKIPKGIFLNYNGKDNPTNGGEEYKPINMSNEEYYQRVRFGRHFKVLYVKVNTVKQNNNVLVVNPLLSENNGRSNGELKELTKMGTGCGTTLDATIKLIQVKDVNKLPVERNYYTWEGADINNILYEAANAKKLAVSTRPPYYADKITLKKDKTCKTSFFAGENGKVAMIDFGKNATYRSADDWEIISCNYMNGVSNGGYNAQKEGLYIKFDTFYYAKAGKYKITVGTKKDYKSYAATASIIVTVARSISSIIINESRDINIYKADNVKATYNTNIIAYSGDGSGKINNPKIKVEIGEDYYGNITPVKGLSVNNKGVISVAKDFEPDNNKTYKIKVTPIDYPTNSHYNSATVCFEKQAINLGSIKFYYKENEDSGYDPLEGNKIPCDIMYNTYFRLFNKNDEAVTDYISLYGFNMNNAVNNNKIVVTSTTIKNVINKPTKCTITAKAIDGTKATATVTIDYVSNNEDYKYLGIFDYQNNELKSFGAEEPATPISVTGYKWDGKVIIFLTDSQATYMPGAYFYEGTLKVKGAKAVINNNNQTMYLMMNGPKAEVTLTKGKKKYNWILTDESLNDKIKAPAISKAEITYYNGPTGSDPVQPLEPVNYRTDKVLYKDYYYHSFGTNYGEYEGSKIILTLQNPVKDAKGNVLENVGVYAYDPKKDSTGDMSVLGTSVKCEYKVENGVAQIEVTPRSNYTFSSGEIDFYFVDKTDITKCLALTPTVFKPSLKAFKKAFKPKSTITMKLIVDKDGNPVKVEPIPFTDAYKGTGIKMVQIENLYNMNVKGTFNTFADDFVIDDRDYSYKIKLSADIENSEVLKDVNKKGVPNPRTGYITWYVYFDDGHSDRYTVKTTINWKVEVQKE